MPTIIDADTHVDESEATWESLGGAAGHSVTVSPMEEEREAPLAAFR